MPVPTVVVIPFRGKLEMTGDLVHQLANYGGADEVHLFDNDSPEGPDAVEDWAWGLGHPNVTVHHRPDATITQMWNEGWQWALEESAGPQVNVAFLNNDITVPPGFLQRLARDLRDHDEAWISYPDYDHQGAVADLGVRVTQGSFRHGGMCGWAFMLKGEAARHGLPFVDEQFQWWCGDDDLAFAVQACGFAQLRCLGLPVAHRGSVTAHERPELHEIGYQDMQRLKEKWGR